MAILAGDVGGTKTLLALYRQNADASWSIQRQQQFASADYASFDHLLDAFVSSMPVTPLQAVCIGVAGPVINGDCRTTNLPWELKCAAISSALQSAPVKLLNDLEAAAWGVIHGSADSWVELNPYAEPNAAGNAAVIAAGTGLGEAILCWTGSQYHVVATEGGHSDFAPLDVQQDALMQYLRAAYAGHVSYERAVSGEGLRNIYQFLKASNFAAETNFVKAQMQQRDPAAVIGEAGVQGQDALCVEALRLFCAIYGAETGNLALKCLPYAGIYLAGGIALKVLPALRQGGFLQAYLNKGRYAALLRKIPLRVCLNPDLVLHGAAQCAESLL